MGRRIETGSPDIEASPFYDKAWIAQQEAKKKRQQRERKRGKSWSTISEEEKADVLECAMYESADLQQIEETKTETRLRYANALLKDFDIKPKENSPYGRLS